MWIHNNQTINSPRGITINGVQHPETIFYLWSKPELAVAPQGHGLIEDAHPALKLSILVVIPVLVVVLVSILAVGDATDSPTV